LLAKLAAHPYTMVFYEAPHRLRATLNELTAALGERQATVARELTKKFEEFIHGSLDSISRHFSETLPRGEFTLIVAGRPAEEVPAGEAAAVSGPDIVPAVLELMQRGLNKKDAIREVASQKGLPKRQVYQAVLEYDVT